MANNDASPDVFQDAIQGNTPNGVSLSVVEDVEAADESSPYMARVLFGNQPRSPRSPRYFDSS